MPKWDNLQVLLEAIDHASGLPFPEPLSAHGRTSEGDTPLHAAAVWGDVDAIELLVRAGADVNAAGDHGRTPLHAAVGQGHVAAVRILIAFGALPTLRTDYGFTATDSAARAGNAELVVLLGGTACEPSGCHPPSG